MAVMFIFGIQMACQMTFTSIGNAKASISVAVVRKFVLLLPLIYLLPRILPMDQTKAVYLSEPIADTLAVTFTVILFTFQFRKRSGAGSKGRGRWRKISSFQLPMF